MSVTMGSPSAAALRRSPMDRPSISSGAGSQSKSAKTSEVLGRSAAADGDPIVTDMDDVDHACYLTAPRLCDILYPTDFAKLGDYVARTAAAASSSSNARVETMKQADFLMKYGAEQVDQTRSWTGYTPLLDDFSNCSVVTAVAWRDDRATDADEEKGLHRKPIRIKR